MQLSFLLLLTSNLLGYGAFVPYFDSSNFITSYVGILAYLIEIFAWKVFHKTRRVRPEEMGLDNALSEVEAAQAHAEVKPEKRAWWKRSKKDTNAEHRRTVEYEVAMEAGSSLRRSSTKGSSFWPSLRKKSKVEPAVFVHELTIV